MTLNKIFVDANILLEIIFQRGKYQQALSLINDNLGNIFISAISIHICAYFIEKSKLTIQDYKDFFDIFSIVELNSNVIYDAMSIYNKDFEDALQVASCSITNCAELWTLDRGIEKNYGSVCNVKVL